MKPYSEWGFGDDVSTTLSENKSCIILPLQRNSIEHSLDRLAKIPGGKAFREVLCGLPVQVSGRNRKSIATWFTGVVEGNSATIVSVVCPDYATKLHPYTGRIMYTFEGIGDGVSPVAQWALEAQEKLWIFFRERYSCKVSFVIAMEDRISEDTCKRVGVPRSEFMKRMRKSQEVLAESAPQGMPLATPFLSRIRPEAWRIAVTQARLFLKEATTQREKVVRRAIDERYGLYCRWSGKLLSEAEVRKVVLSQMFEYAATGLYIECVLPNAFMLAEDPVTAPFIQWITGSLLPLASLERPKS